MFDFPATRLESPLRKFIALQKDALLILGPRRVPPLPCPASSTSTSIAAVTSFGFRMLECGEYVQAVQTLRPDIVLGMGDVLYGHEPGVKRLQRMGDRTQSWLNALIAGMSDVQDGTPRTALFAPILPIDARQQYWYLSALEEDFRDHISGLVLHEIDSIAAIPDILSHLPRCFFGDVKTPHQLLDSIDAAIDIFTLPFVNESTDSGFALDFSIGTPSQKNDEQGLKPLALDMWSNDHASDLSPLRESCACYTCTHHHRAYIQHLLNTNEMLSWVLLQLHNYHVLGEFFKNIRQSIMKNTFQEDKTIFGHAYERDWPSKTGRGPR